MNVKHFMTRGVECVPLECSVQDAARKMKEKNIGILPVFDAQGLRGVLTDRDIVVRALWEGHDPRKIMVGEIMTKDPVCCYEDESLQNACKIMEDKKIRRVLVRDRGDDLVGVLSLDDFTKRKPGIRMVGEVLSATAVRHV